MELKEQELEEKLKLNRQLLEGIDYVDEDDAAYPAGLGAPADEGKRAPCRDCAKRTARLLDLLPLRARVRQISVEFD